MSILERMRQAMSLLTKAQLLAKRLRAEALANPNKPVREFFEIEAQAVTELCEAEL